MPRPDRARDRTTTAAYVSLRTATRAFVQRRFPEEVSVFELVWERALAWCADDGVILEGAGVPARIRAGLGFDDASGQRLMSLYASCVTLIVWNRLAARLEGTGDLDAIREEFLVITEALGEPRAFAEQLILDLGPAMLLLGPPQQRAEGDGDRALEPWLAHWWTPAMRDEGQTLAKPARAPLELLKQRPELRPEGFMLFVDESDDRGIALRASPGATVSYKHWSEFVGQQARFLRCVLVGLCGRTRLRLDRNHLWSVLRVRRQGSKGSGSNAVVANPDNRVKSIKAALADTIPCLDDLIQSDGEGGYHLQAKVSYCWIRPERGVGRLPSINPATQ